MEPVSTTVSDPWPALQARRIYLADSMLAMPLSLCRAYVFSCAASEYQECFVGNGDGKKMQIDANSNLFIYFFIYLFIYLFIMKIVHEVHSRPKHSSSIQ